MPRIEATWIWDTPSAIANEQETLDFLTKQHVKSVYVQYDDTVSDEQYARFFEKLQQQSIAIYALDGNTNWLAQPARMTAFVEWVAQFQQQYHLLTGVHADIEPYTLPTWHAQTQPLLTQYFQLVITLKELTIASDLLLQLAIPFWFDEVQYTNKYGNGIVSEWLIDQADAVAIMAYRNTAEQVLPLVQQEIDYANAGNGRVIVALETARSEEGENISFYNKPIQAVTDEVKIVYEALQEEASFQGIAIHSFHSWKDMLQ